MTTYRTAIIGLSWIATDPPPAGLGPVLGTSIPYSHAAALAAVPNIEVVAGCDINPAMREQFLERWSGRWPGATTYENYREMLEATKPDIVSIVTPDFLHADPFLAAIEHGARGIFCDKPLATNLADADRMVAAAQGGRHRREHQLHAALDPAVRERAGDPAVRADRRPRPDHRRDRRPAGDAVPQPHPPRRPALLLRRRGARVGLGRARARLRGLRHSSTRATAARPSRPSPPRTTTSRSRTASART